MTDAVRQGNAVARSGLLEILLPIESKRRFITVHFNSRSEAVRSVAIVGMVILYFVISAFDRSLREYFLFVVAIFTFQALMLWREQLRSRLSARERRAVPVRIFSWSAFTFDCTIIVGLTLFLIHLISD